MKENKKYATTTFHHRVAADTDYLRGSKKIIKNGGFKMTRDKMIEIVDLLCENNGYENSPAYDLIYDECVKGRSDADAKKMILDLIKEYNQ
jgi:hypothetical protein